MPQNALDYRTPDKGPPTPLNDAVLKAASFSGGFTFLVNTVLYCWAYTERGWGAILIGVAAFPANLLLLLISLAFIPTVRRAARGDRIRAYVLVAILVPIIAMILFAYGMSAIPRDEHAAP